MSSKNVESITIPPELEAEMTPAVRAFVGLLLDRIAKPERRVEELERGPKTPQNSSLPPSSQHPHAKPRPPKRKSRKKRGGQPGHERHFRPLIPTDECDDVQPLKPTE
jgi:transposase